MGVAASSANADAMTEGEQQPSPAAHPATFTPSTAVITQPPSAEGGTTSSSTIIIPAEITAGATLETYYSPICGAVPFDEHTGQHVNLFCFICGANCSTKGYFHGVWGVKEHMKRTHQQKGDFKQTFGVEIEDVYERFVDLVIRPFCMQVLPQTTLQQWTVKGVPQEHYRRGDNKKAAKFKATLPPARHIVLPRQVINSTAGPTAQTSQQLIWVANDNTASHRRAPVGGVPNSVGTATKPWPLSTEIASKQAPRGVKQDGIAGKSITTTNPSEPRVGFDRDDDGSGGSASDGRDGRSQGAAAQRRDHELQSQQKSASGMPMQSHYVEGGGRDEMLSPNLFTYFRGGPAFISPRPHAKASATFCANWNVLETKTCGKVYHAKHLHRCAVVAQWLFGNAFLIACPHCGQNADDNMQFFDGLGGVLSHIQYKHPREWKYWQYAIDECIKRCTSTIIRHEDVFVIEQGLQSVQMRGPGFREGGDSERMDIDDLDSHEDELDIQKSARVLIAAAEVQDENCEAMDTDCSDSDDEPLLTRTRR